MSTTIQQLINRRHDIADRLATRTLESAIDDTSRDLALEWFDLNQQIVRQYTADVRAALDQGAAT